MVWGSPVPGWVLLLPFGPAPVGPGAVRIGPGPSASAWPRPGPGTRASLAVAAVPGTFFGISVRRPSPGPRDHRTRRFMIDGPAVGMSAPGRPHGHPAPLGARFFDLGRTL
ncbi:hypothetical protein GCM10009548_13290 [Streptomyces malaysiensis subsp. malaysiensis]